MASNAQRKPSQEAGRIFFLPGLLLSLMLCGVGLPAEGASDPIARGSASSDGQYVLSLYQRALDVGAALLEFEKLVILRLEKNRPVDAPQAKARFRSARKQMKELRKMAKHFEKRLASGNPLESRIEAAKGGIHTIKEAHRANMARFKSLAADDLAEAGKVIEEIDVPDPDPTPQGTPVDTLDSQF